MKKTFLTPLIFTCILAAGLPMAASAVAPSQTPEYQKAYVPCGTDDIGMAIKDPATGKVTGIGPTKIIKADGTIQTLPMGKEGGDGIVDNPCEFKDVIGLAKRLIMGLLGALVIFASLGFAYAGFLYITAMGSQEKISHAHSIFTKTFLGFVFALSAWLIAKTLENHFLNDFYAPKSFLEDPPPDKKATTP